MRPEHPAPFGAQWQAKWIWHGSPKISLETATRPVQADPRDRIVHLRRVVAFDVVPMAVPARIWVDGRYILYVNGNEVWRGPVRSDPRRARYDVVDMAPWLVPGDNVVAVLARHYGRATSWWMPAPASYTLGAGGIVFEADLGSDRLVSDRRWRTARGEAWSAVTMPGNVANLPLESFDARSYPHRWLDVDFDDSSWSPAFEITPFHTGSHGTMSPPSEPFGALLPPVRRSVPTGARHRADVVHEMRIRGAEVVADPVVQILGDQDTDTVDQGDGIVSMTFDLGRIAAGTVLLDVQDATAGTVIDIAASEHVDAQGRLVPLGQHAGFRYVCSDQNAQSFETFDPIGTRYLRASIRTTDTVPTLTVHVQDRHRPRPDGATFECSDPVLNTIHATGLRTVDLCALDSYVDCPTREQRAWTGDSVVHQMVDLVTNPDWSMARWHPQLATMTRADGMLAMAAASDFAQDDQMFVPDWSLHWVRSVHNLYRYTGDRDLVADFLPVAERTLRWFETYLARDGLLHEVSGWVLLDWSSVYSRGCSSTLNGLWARALEDLAEMSAWLGNRATQEWALERRRGVKDAFDVFWDDERGVYVDHIVDGTVRRQAAQHPGAVALAADLVPTDRIDRVVAGITDRSRLIRHSWVMDSVTVDGGSTGFVHLTTGYPDPVWNVDTQMVEAQPFFRYVVHDGLARAGRADLIADLCRDWSVFLDRGETSWPECWQGGSRCHGWSSTPSRDLIVHVLGIQPGSPGYDTVRVEPALGGLDWARASVPTPHGPITVEARADGHLSIDSPVPVETSARS